MLLVGVGLLAVKFAYLICMVVNCWLALDVLGIRCLVNSCVLLLIVIIAHFVGLGLGLGCLLLDGFIGVLYFGLTACC